MTDIGNYLKNYDPNWPGLRKHIKDTKPRVKGDFEVDESYDEALEKGEVYLDDDEEESDAFAGVKARLRRVRTREGAQQYGLPIGSIIRPDADLQRPINLGPVVKDSSVRTPKDWEEDPKNPGKAYRRRIHGVGTARVWYSEASGSWFWRFSEPGSGQRMAVQQGSADGPHDAFQEAIQRLDDAHAAWERNRKRGVKDPHERKAVPGSFFDTYQGIRGYDWELNENEGEAIDWNDENDIERKRLVKQEFDDLGIDFYGSTHIDYAETAAATMRSYANMFPGLFYYMHSLNFEMENPGVGGSNTHSPPERAFMHDRPDFDGNYPRNWDSSVIQISTEYYGTSGDVTGIETMADNHEDMNWFSSRLSEVVKQRGVELWQADLMNLINHELGHTMARIAFGHMSGEKTATQGQDRVTRRDYFWDRLQTIFEEHGLGFDANMGHSDPRSGGGNIFFPPPPDASNALGPRNETVRRDMLVGFDRDDVKEVLSDYGRHNIHEMMAESWAEYMMDPEPRSFAREVGSLLEELVNEFLDNEEAR